MTNKIIQFTLENEMDIVMAHKRAIQVAELTGLTISDQTRFATAVSEISRNCVEHAKKGSIKFSIVHEKKDKMILQARIEDKGPGIPDLEKILSRNNINLRFPGVGIINSRKLVDDFKINTGEKGTQVILEKIIPKNHPPINNIILKGWHKHFAKQTSVSPYEEIKNRNIQLLELAEQLKFKKQEAELQIEEIKKLNNVLETKNENLKQIAYAIAHDLKNPISAIQLMCDVVRSEEKPVGELKLVETVQKNLERLMAIIDGLQNTIDQDPDVAISAELIDMRMMSSELYEQFHSYIEQQKGRLLFDFEEPAVVRYPKVYLNSILGNLISNSIKYASSQPLEIKVRGYWQNDLYKLEVSDNGIGIDLDKYGHQLFKPFKRFTKQSDGRGMGLSIIYYITTKNGGDIEVESVPGKGTTFCCYLKEYSGVSYEN